MTTYKVILTDSTKAEADINALAAKGYEVVAASSTAAGAITVVMKLTA